MIISRRLSYYCLCAALVFGAAGYLSLAYLNRPVYETSRQKTLPTKIEDLSYLKDISSQDILKNIPARRPGSFTIGELRKDIYFTYMSTTPPVKALYASLQERRWPIGLQIQSGVLSLEDVEDGVNITRVGEEWHVNVPILIHPGATLVIDEDIPVILKADKASFISNFGTLYIAGSIIKSSKVSSEDGKKFRPFIVTWSGGEAYFADSKFYDLGYNYTKSYGITFSSSGGMKRKDAKVPAPKGKLIGNHFENFYYGLYTYEAEDVVVARNVYKDNIVYGIDPHDYSRNLTIALNDVYGTKKRHGIIFSRFVTDSQVYANHTHHNARSGIMMDRSSSRNLIAENIVEENGTDGVVFHESGDNISYKNIIRRNGKSGIRVRNSKDLQFIGDEVVNNKDYGFLAYARDLSEQTMRDLVKDFYHTALDFTMIDCRLVDNGRAAIRTQGADRARLSNMVMLGSPKLANGDFQNYAADIHAYGTIKNDGIILTRQNRTYADFLSMR